MDELKKIIDKYEIISFDIFDTLLYRELVFPGNVFSYIENKYNFKNFMQNRTYSEQAYRVLKKARNIDCEDITYNDIYLKLDKNYPKAKDLELEVEYNILKANEDMLDCYNYALQQNKKIILISDMYLDSSFLEKVLNKNGYYNFDKIYVSSETKKLKNTGAMFKHVIKDLNINPSKILHIGDNMVSDFDKAIENGITAYHYVSHIELYDSLNHYLLQKIKPFPSLKVLESINILKWEKEHRYNKINYWERFAYKIGGPIALTWLVNLIQISKYRNLTDIYFIARDGYMLKMIYDMVYDEKTMPKPHYVYATRKLKTSCLNKNLEIIDNESSNEYNNYINSISTNGKNIGLVDTCAGGYSAQTLIEAFDKQKQFLGIYFISNFNPQYNSINLSSISRNSIDKLFTWDIIEILFSSPEYPVIGIKNRKPIYRKDNNDAEIYHKQIYPYIEKGILDYVKDFLSIYNGLNFKFNMEDVFKLLTHYWHNLNETDILNLSKISLPQDSSQKIYWTLIEMDTSLIKKGIRL